jgi:flavin-dependent dehydrogenase
MARGGHLGERAIVVGGGMGGLFSARVLSDHFDEVIVLDRDDEPTAAEPRGTDISVLRRPLSAIRTLTPA